MSNQAESYPGARFYKADLHVHTPASRCWDGKRDEKALSRIFDKLKKEHIDIVAITDHNNAASIDEAKKLGKKHFIHVFPGVEVSTKEGHVIALFDPSKTGKDIENWLASVVRLTLLYIW